MMAAIDYGPLRKELEDKKVDLAARLDRIKRFDMPEFQPRDEYVREMKRFGILPVDSTGEATIDDVQLRIWDPANQPRPVQLRPIALNSDDAESTKR